jgi:hypothetical protein
MKSKQHIYSTCGKKYSRRVRQHANRQNHAASGWRIHCGVEVTELSTNKQHTLSHDASHFDTMKQMKNEGEKQHANLQRRFTFSNNETKK